MAKCFVINNDVETTTSIDVVLTNNVEGFTEMRFRNENEAWIYDGTGHEVGWEPYDVTKDWTLSAGYGAKVVYGQFSDGATKRQCTSGITYVQILAPMNISAVAGNAVIDIVWQDMSAIIGNLMGYNLYRSLVSGRSYEKINGETLITAASYKDLNVINGVTYYYVATCVVDGHYQSSNSNETNATPYIAQRNLDKSFITFLGMDDNVKVYWTDGILYSERGIFKVVGNISSLPPVVSKFSTDGMEAIDINGYEHIDFEGSVEEDSEE